MRAAEKARQLAFVTTERTRIANLKCEDVVAIGRAPYTNWIGQEGRTRHGDRHAVALLGRHGGLCGAHDGQDVGRRVPAHHDCPCFGSGYAHHPVGRPTSFLDMPNRYELCSLLARLAHNEGKCILFSTHELDIALSLSDRIALIDTPVLHCMPTYEMIRSGHIERLFNNAAVQFDPVSGIVKSIPRD